MTIQTLQFNADTSVSVIIHNNRRWLTAEDVGRCLGYGQGNERDGIIRAYNRHTDEFSDEDTCTVKLTVQGQGREIRIFSQTGCMKLGFFSNTPRAKHFRKWAAKVLADETEVPQHQLFNSELAADMKLLAQGMALVLQQNQLTHRYIDLLERNQKSRARISPEHAVEAKKLVAAGFSQSQAARELGISKAAVNALVNDKYEFGGEWAKPGPMKLLQQQLDEQRNVLIEALQIAEKGE